MRLEATLPDTRGAAVVKMADELGLTRSQLVDEALALFMKVVLEVKRGRRVVMRDPSHQEPDRELVTPTLSTLEWSAMELSAEALEKMAEVIVSPPAPSRFMEEAKHERARRVAQADRSKRSGR